MWRERPFPQSPTFIDPCLPRAAKQPPSGRGWIHEIKHDGFRIMARRADGRVRLLTRNGTNFSNRFPQIVAAVTVLPVRSCLLDGEAVVCNEEGLAVFELIRGYRHDTAAALCTFDLREVDGKDLRRAPIEERKRTLAKLLSHPHAGIAFNQHYDADGAIIYKHACALGCEGIVSKRRGSAYRSGRVAHWLKVKNPAAPAVRREAEEDWGRRRYSR
jgi:bifunctional non-homologous end joining protein LigD